MAFTSTERAEIYFFTGWTQKWRQIDEALENAILLAETSPDVSALVLNCVAKCKDIDAKLLDAQSRLKALKLGSITLPGKNEMDELKKMGRLWAARLATSLGVEIRQDVFSSSRPHGNSGGNYEKHG